MGLILCCWNLEVLSAKVVNLQNLHENSVCWCRVCVLICAKDWILSQLCGFHLYPMVFVGWVCPGVMTTLICKFRKKKLEAPNWYHKPPIHHLPFLSSPQGDLRLLPFLPSPLTQESSCTSFSLFVPKFSHWLEQNLFSAACLGRVDILESFQLLTPMRTGIGLYKDFVTFKSFSHLEHLYCLQCILLIMCWCFSQLWFGIQKLTRKYVIQGKHHSFSLCLCVLMLLVGLLIDFGNRSFNIL